VAATIIMAATTTTLHAPRRAVVEVDVPGAGRRHRDGSVLLTVSRGDHIIVMDKVAAGLYLVRACVSHRLGRDHRSPRVFLRAQAVARGVAGTIRKKHFAYLKKADAPTFELPPLAALEALVAPLREKLLSHTDEDDAPADHPDASAPAAPPVPAPEAAVSVAPASDAGAGIGEGAGVGDDDADDKAAAAAGATIIKRTGLDDDQVDTYGFEHDPTVEEDLGTYVRRASCLPLHNVGSHARVPQRAHRQGRGASAKVAQDDGQDVGPAQREQARGTCPASPSRRRDQPTEPVGQLVRRCWKGIPRAVRWQAWSVLVGAHATRQRLLQVAPGHDGSEPFRVRVPSSPQGDGLPSPPGRIGPQRYLDRERAEIDDVIDRDIDRCLPTHQRFRQVNGEAYARSRALPAARRPLQLTVPPSRQRALEDVLKAYAGYNPELGYCQGMGMVVGILLLHMPPDVCGRAPSCQIARVAHHRRRRRTRSGSWSPSSTRTST
jgi:hypothetical protein